MCTSCLFFRFVVVVFFFYEHEQNASYTTTVNYCAVITSVVMAVELPEDIINQAYIYAF